MTSYPDEGKVGPHDVHIVTEALLGLETVLRIMFTAKGKRQKLIFNSRCFSHLYSKMKKNSFAIKGDFLRLIYVVNFFLPAVCRLL